MRKILLLTILGLMVYFQVWGAYFYAGADQTRPCANLTSVSGPIKHGSPDSQTFKLYGPDEAKQLKIMERDRIMTGDDTTAELLLSGSARIGISEKTQIQVGYYNLRIKNGDVWVNYKPSKNGEKTTFKVHTPAGTIGVKGTCFEVRAFDETGSTYVRVIEGLVSFETLDGVQSVIISSGEELSCEKGGKIGAPSKFKTGGATIQDKMVREKSSKDDQVPEAAAGEREPSRAPFKKTGLFDDMSGYSIEILKK